MSIGGTSHEVQFSSRSIRSFTVFYSPNNPNVLRLQNGNSDYLLKRSSVVIEEGCNPISICSDNEDILEDENIPDDEDIETPQP